MTGKQYITLEETDTEGFPYNPTIYYVDTDAEIAIAERALSEAGVGEAEVWVGEDEDAVKTSMKIFAKRALSDEEIDSVAADWLKGDLAECADGEVLDVEGPVGCDFDELNCCKYQLSLYDTMGTRDDDELSAVVKSYREQLKAHYETIATVAPTECEDCGDILKLRVLRSNARSYIGTEFYIGTSCDCGPYSRDSGYYRTYKQAERALLSGEYYLQ